MLPVAPGANLDDELLAEMLRQKLGDEPCCNVGRARGCLTDDHLNGPRRIVERKRVARRDRHCRNRRP
jgi:hypothetical protein